ncbi:response regulator [Streptomyces sp. NPDC057496]|uniref:response regulator n=1 Tax=Streptomyces sp. NPDC057496 TaxID=3346149 RepID=UPI0036A5C49E
MTHPVEPADGLPPSAELPDGAGPFRGTEPSADAGPFRGAESSGGPIRVLIADDQTLLRGSLRVLVDAEPGLVATSEAANGTEAVRCARQDLPDVVLMDVRMPGMDGIEATRQICGSPGTADVKVLMLTMFDLDEYVYAALRAGASGFLLKDTPPGELISAIRVIAAGDALLAPAVTRRLIAEFARRPQPSRPLPGTLDGVTGREREVLVLVARGLSNTEIAERMYLGLATVKTHIGRLLTKLGCRDRAQLVIVAYESGLVTAARPPAGP